MANVRARRALYAWFLIATLSCLLIYGEHQDDELGSVSAFYLLKAGVMQAEYMAWEYPAQIRPWLQPGMYYALLGGLIDPTSPYGYPHLELERAMLLIQLGLLALAAWLLRPLLLAAPLDSPRQRLVAACWAFLWFAPSMLVRHSSEAFSTALWAMSAALWWQVERDAPRESATGWKIGAASGIVAGLAVWGRFQLGFLVAPFWVARWFDRSGKRPAWALIAYAAGIVIAVVAGVAIDSWGYGAPTFTPWRYFAANVIDGMASTFGTSPWHHYFGDVIVLTLNPLVWAWLGWAAWVTRRDPFYRSLSIAVAIFFAVHSATPHKEERFLLPLFVPVLLILLSALNELRNEQATVWQRRLFAQPYLRFVLTLNVIALVGYTAFALVSDRGRVDRALWRLPHEQRTVLSATNLFGYFDEYDPARLPSGTDHVSYRRFLLPPWLHYTYVSTEDFSAACARDPQALQLRTNYELGPDSNPLRHGEPLREAEDADTVIAEFPPSWLHSDASWFRRMWRFSLMTCADP